MAISCSPSCRFAFNLSLWNFHLAPTPSMGHQTNAQLQVISSGQKRSGRHRTHAHDSKRSFHDEGLQRRVVCRPVLHVGRKNPSRLKNWHAFPPQTRSSAGNATELPLASTGSLAADGQPEHLNQHQIGLQGGSNLACVNPKTGKCPKIMLYYLRAVFPMPRLDALQATPSVIFRRRPHQSQKLTAPQTGVGVRVG